MTFPFKVRITRAVSCREGFYLVINGSRIRFQRKADAISAVFSWLDLQRVQIVSVREYALRTANQIKARMPKEGE